MRPLQITRSQSLSNLNVSTSDEAESTTPTNVNGAPAKSPNQQLETGIQPDTQRMSTNESSSINIDLTANSKPAPQCVATAAAMMSPLSYHTDGSQTMSSVSSMSPDFYMTHSRPHSQGCGTTQEPMGQPTSELQAMAMFMSMSMNEQRSSQRRHAPRINYDKKMLVLCSRQPLALKDFNNEIRAFMDVESFLHQAILLLDLEVNSMHEVIDCMLG
ncbi:hypothetical protein GZH46_02254, partial [Fragariocoptes setiger]